MVHCLKAVLCKIINDNTTQTSYFVCLRMTTAKKSSSCCRLSAAPIAVTVLQPKLLQLIFTPRVTAGLFCSVFQITSVLPRLGQLPVQMGENLLSTKSTSSKSKSCVSSTFSPKGRISEAALVKPACSINDIYLVVLILQGFGDCIPGQSWFRSC